ncbi:MAG: PD-(D/E)XK nuclease family protein [Brevinemataceae bacterium]
MHLLLGKFGSGKTSYIFNQSLKLLKENKTLWIIVPSRIHKNTFSLKLSENLTSIQGNPILTLQELQQFLFTRISPLSPTPPPIHVSNFQKFLILSNIIKELAPQFKSFKNITDRTDIINMIYKLTNSLQEKDIDHLVSNEYLEDKVHDLNLILTNYRSILSNNNFGDQRCEINYICNNLSLIPPDKIPEYIFFDGFIDFNSIEFKLTASLLEYAEKNNISSLISVSTDPHSKFKDILQKLKKRFPNASEILLTHSTPSSLLAESFLQNTEYHEENLQITEIQAFGIHKEIQEVVNQIKALCINEQYTFKDMVIITNRPDKYNSILSTQLYRAGIPFVFGTEELLIDNPLIQFIKRCLNIMKKGEIDNQTLEFFANTNYIKEPIRILLGKISETFTIAVKGNQQSWESAFQRQLELFNMNNEEIDNSFFQMKDLIQELCSYLFSEKSYQKVSAVSHIDRLINLLDFLGVQETLSFSHLLTSHKQMIDVSISKDFAAMSKLIEMLSELQDSLTKTAFETLTFNSFTSFFDVIVQEIRYRTDIPKQNILNILVPSDVKGLFFKAVFILGMNENEWPSAPKYDLFDHFDRTELNITSAKILGYPIWETNQEYFSEEKLMFALSVSRALEKVFFSHTPINEKGVYFEISHFLQKIFSHPISIQRIPYCSHAPKNSVFNNPGIFNQSVAPEEYYELSYIPIANSALNEKTKLSAQYLTDIEHANQEFDNQQLPSEHLQQYFGYLQELPQITERYKGNIHTSATKLEMLGKCRYRGLWQGFWKLKTRKLPQYHPEAQDYGLLYHYVLEHYIQKMQQDKNTLYNPEIIHNIIIEFINSSPYSKALILDYCFIFTTISLFIQNIELPILQEDQQALYFEIQSGTEVIPVQTIDITSSLILTVYGRIDRINQNNTTGGYHIIDYKKTGSTYSEYQKIPFHLFQGFIYAALLYINNKTNIERISYILLEKDQQIVPEYPAQIKKVNVFDGIHEFFTIKKSEIRQLMTLAHKGNFSPFTLDKDIGEEVSEWFSKKFGENFLKEYNNKCKYCELHKICLRKNKKIVKS